MTDPGMVLEARDLAVGYDGRAILQHVDLTIGAGEFWVVLGPNGAGKTTLLRTVVGVLAPCGGVLHMAPDLTSRERLGFVPQRCDMNPALPTTVREFVLLGTVGVRATRAEELVRLEWALEHAGLAGMATRDYWSLSGGQRQRASVARALVRRPRFLVLDEPTIHLDPGAEHALLRLLTDLHRDEGLTVLVVTHDIGIAVRHATHVALVTAGSVRAGRRDDVLTDGAVAAAYGIAVPLERA